MITVHRASGAENRISSQEERLAQAARPKSTKQTAEDDDYETLEYNGLIARGAVISYLGRPIYMGFQQRQVVRAFLKRPESILPPDVFTGDENPDIFASKREYRRGKKATLGKLIPAVHKI